MDYERLVGEIASGAYLVCMVESKSGSKNRKTHIVKLLGENQEPNDKNESGYNTIGYGRTQEEAWQDAYGKLMERHSPNPFPDI